MPYHTAHNLSHTLSYSISAINKALFFFQIVNFNHVTFQPLSADQVVAKGARPATQSAPKDLLQLIPKVRANGVGAS